MSSTSAIRRELELEKNHVKAPTGSDTPDFCNSFHDSLSECSSSVAYGSEGVFKSVKAK
jgi:hypothetical protein